MNRIISSLSVGLLAFAGMLLGASPAHAGVDPSSAWLQNPDQEILPSSRCSFSGSQSLSVVGNPGSSFTLYLAFWCYNAAPAKPTITISNSSVVSGPTGTPSSAALAYTIRSTGTSTVSITYPDSRGTATITFNGTTTPVTTPQVTIHDDLQQVGVPKSGTCADVPESVGHYPGAPIGGWSKSWAWWINDGKGGPVCTRELEELSNGEIVLVG